MPAGWRILCAGRAGAVHHDEAGGFSVGLIVEIALAAVVCGLLLAAIGIRRELILMRRDLEAARVDMSRGLETLSWQLRMLQEGEAAAAAARARPEASTGVSQGENARTPLYDLTARSVRRDDFTLIEGGKE